MEKPKPKKKPARTFLDDQIDNDLANQVNNLFRQPDPFLADWDDITLRTDRIDITGIDTSEIDQNLDQERIDLDNPEHVAMFAELFRDDDVSNLGSAPTGDGTGLSAMDHQPNIDHDILGQPEQPAQSGSSDVPPLVDVATPPTIGSQADPPVDPAFDPPIDPAIDPQVELQPEEANKENMPPQPAFNVRGSNFGWIFIKLFFFS